MKITTIFSFSAVIFLEILMLQITLKAEDAIPSKLAALKTTIDSKRSGISVSEVEPVATELANVLPDVDFSPTAGASGRIKAVSKITIALLCTASVPKQNLNNINPTAISVAEMSLEKITSKIDDKWVFLLGSANVAPPAGVPCASAGMNPDTIADPKLRQQYLDRIKAEKTKNLINAQQSELRRSRDAILRAIVDVSSKNSLNGWTRADILTRFGKNEECRKILEENLRKNGSR